MKRIDWFSPSGEKIESSRQDITVIRNDETSSTLTIYNAIIDNAGTYKCVATSGDQQAEATVNVKIYRTATSALLDPRFQPFSLLNLSSRTLL